MPKKEKKPPKPRNLPKERPKQPKCKCPDQILLSPTGVNGKVTYCKKHGAVNSEGKKNETTG